MISKLKSNETPNSFRKSLDVSAIYHQYHYSRWSEHRGMIIVIKERLTDEQQKERDVSQRVEVIEHPHDPSS